MAIQDTGWRAPNLVRTADGIAGQVIPATGMESKPCCMCGSYDKDNRKLVQYLIAHGLTPDETGHFVTPIVNDFKDGRQSMRIHPDNFGFCIRECMPVDMRATCEKWRPTNTREDLRRKIR
jgi:hypothetical protein